MKAARVKALVQSHWDTLRQVANRELLDKALDASREVEADHRRFMRRGFHDMGGRYALSIELTARYQVLHIVSQCRSTPVTWADFCSYRRDIPLCMCVREDLLARGMFTFCETSADFQAIDYAGDIAL